MILPIAFCCRSTISAIRKWRYVEFSFFRLFLDIFFLFRNFSSLCTYKIALRNTLGLRWTSYIWPTIWWSFYFLTLNFICSSFIIYRVLLHRATCFSNSIHYFAFVFLTLLIGVLCSLWSRKFLLFLFLGCCRFVPLPFRFLLVGFFWFRPIYILQYIINFHFVHLHIIVSRYYFLFWNRICSFIISGILVNSTLFLSPYSSCYFSCRLLKCLSLTHRSFSCPLSCLLKHFILIHIVITASTTFTTFIILFITPFRPLTSIMIIPRTILMITVRMAIVTRIWTVSILMLMLMTHIITMPSLRLLLILCCSISLPRSILWLSRSCPGSFGSSICLSLLLCKSLLFQSLSFSSRVIKIYLSFVLFGKVRIFFW